MLVGTTQAVQHWQALQQLAVLQGSTQAVHAGLNSFCCGGFFWREDTLACRTPHVRN
jgi:hypothetical protein